MAGFIYIMSNPSFGGLIKIGKSDFDPVKRKDELDNTSVPDSFKIEYYAFTENHHELEKLVHQTLQHFRHKKNREFFNCQIDTAAKIIRDLAKENLKYQEINYTIDEEEEIEEEEIKEDNIMNEFDKKFYYALAMLGIFIFMFYVLI